MTKFLLLEKINPRLVVLVLLIGLVVISTIFLFYMNNTSQDIRSRASDPYAPSCTSPNVCMSSCPAGYTKVGSCTNGDCCQPLPNPSQNLSTCNYPNECSYFGCPDGRIKLGNCSVGDFIGSCCAPRDPNALCLKVGSDCLDNSDCCQDQGLSCIGLYCQVPVCTAGSYRCNANFLQLCRVPAYNGWMDLMYCPTNICFIPAPQVGALCYIVDPVEICFQNGMKRCVNGQTSGVIQECIDFRWQTLKFCVKQCDSSSLTCN